MKLGRLDEAAKALETAVGLAPDMSNAWINFGQTLLLQKQLGKGIVALERAIKLNPQAADARLYLARAYLGGKQYERARSILDELLRLQPESASALALMTWLNLVEGKGQEAQTSYLRMKAKSPLEAANFRASAIAKSVPGAVELPE